MNTPGQAIELYRRLPVVRFSAKPPTGSDVRSVDSLCTYLETLERHTNVVPILERDEVLLTHRAKTRHGGYGLTSFAFNQAAQILIPGTSAMLPVLAGLRGSRDDDSRNLIDGGMAVTLWNSLVDLRFPLLSTHMMLLNENSLTLDGFITMRHKYLQSSIMHGMVLENIPQTFKLFAAVVSNRRLTMWVRQERPRLLFTAGSHKYPIYDGYYFLNGEATGTAVRATRCLYFPFGVCMAPYDKYGGRVTHSGKDFMGRVGNLLTRVVASEFPWDVIEEGCRRLHSVSLGYTTQSRKAVQERTKKLQDALTLLGLQRGIARDVMDNVLLFGRDYRPRMVAEDISVSLPYASRTLLDLFVPLVTMARQYDTSIRERMEQTAFSVLTDQLLL